MTAALVQTSEVQTLVDRQVPQATLSLAIELAEGWLAPRVRSIAWPPDQAQQPAAYRDLRVALLELAALAADNPTSMRTSTTGGVTDEWQTARRAEILADVEARYGGAAPLGSFPPTPAWPL